MECSKNAIPDMSRPRTIPAVGEWCPSSAASCSGPAAFCIDRRCGSRRLEVRLRRLQAGMSALYDARLSRTPQRVSAQRSHVAFELPQRRTDSAGAVNRNGKGSDDADPDLEPVGEFERTSAAGNGPAAVYSLRSDDLVRA